ILYWARAPADRGTMVWVFRWVLRPALRRACNSLPAIAFSVKHRWQLRECLGIGCATILLCASFALFAAAAADSLFQTGFLSYDVANEPSSIAVGDLNGDGRPDLVTANRGGFAFRPGSVSVLLANSDGTFGPATNLPLAEPDPLSLAIGDLNGDGR